MLQRLDAFCGGLPDRPAYYASQLVPTLVVDYLIWPPEPD